LFLFNAVSIKQYSSLTAGPGSPVSPFFPRFPRLPGGPGGHKHCADVASRLFLSGCRSSPVTVVPDGPSASCRCMEATAASRSATRRSIVPCTCHTYTTTVRHNAAAPVHRATADARRTAAVCCRSTVVPAAMCAAAGLPNGFVVVVVVLVVLIVVVVVDYTPILFLSFASVLHTTRALATPLSDLLEVPAGSYHRHRFEHFNRYYNII